MSPENLSSAEKPGLAVAEILIDAGCVDLDFTGPGFEFSHGIQSPIIIDCKRLVDSSHFKKIASDLETLINSTFRDFTFLCGVIRGGMPFAKSLGTRLGLSVVTRLGKPIDQVDEEKIKMVSGEIVCHSKGLIIDDVLTTGGNVETCVEQIRAEKGCVLATVVIFDYGFTKAHGKLRELGLNRWYLTNFQQLLLAGESSGHFENWQIEELNNWWQKTSEFLDKQPVTAVRMLGNDY